MAIARAANASSIGCCRPIASPSPGSASARRRRSFTVRSRAGSSRRSRGWSARRRRSCAAIAQHRAGRGAWRSSAAIRGSLEPVLARECAGMSRAGGRRAVPRRSRDAGARQGAATPITTAEETMQALAALFTGLRSIDAPKTLIFISEGFVLDDDLARIIELGALAASARTSLFALRLDYAAVRHHRRARAGQPVRRSPGAGRRARNAGGRHARRPVHRDRHRARRCSTGSHPSCPATTCWASSRTRRDKDGKPHPIRVEVPRRGAFVRSRRQLMNAASDRPARAAVAAPGGRGGARARRCSRPRCRCGWRRSRCRARSATRCSC